MDTQRRIDRECRPQQPCSRSAARGARPPCDGTCRSLTHTAQLGVRVPPGARELTKELEEGIGGLLQILRLELEPETEAPRELDVALGQRGCRCRDLRERDAPAEFALELRPTSRGLLGMEAVEDERLRDGVALRKGEHSRPELEVLALAERLVVAQPVPLEELVVERDRVVEEGRGAEERVPTRHGGATFGDVDLPESPSGGELEYARADERDLGLRLQSRQHTRQPVRESDVVGVHARDIAAADLVEPPVEGASESQALAVPDHAQP